MKLSRLTITVCIHQGLYKYAQFTRCCGPTTLLKPVNFSNIS